jgi:hypothetical protein
MQFQNIFFPILLMNCVQIRKKYTLVMMLQDETKLCDSTVVKCLTLTSQISI